MSSFFENKSVWAAMVDCNRKGLLIVDVPVLCEQIDHEGSGMEGVHWETSINGAHIIVEKDGLDLEPACVQDDLGTQVVFASDSYEKVETFIESVKATLSLVKKSLYVLT